MEGGTGGGEYQRGERRGSRKRVKSSPEMPARENESATGGRRGKVVGPDPGSCQGTKGKRRVGNEVGTEGEEW